MAAASPLSKRGGNSTKPAGKRKGKPGAADRSIKPGGSRGVNKHGKKRGSFNADRQKGSRPSKQGRTDNSGPQTQAEASSAASAAAPKLPMGESTAAGRKAVLAARQSKKSTMLKAAEYKALREQSAVISTAGLEEQAEWLWQHHSLASGASSLERGGFSDECLISLPSSSEGLVGELKQHVQAAAPSADGGPNGAPVVLVLAASAVAANNIVKKLRDPAFGCVAKLFAKHIKVEEQRKVLQSGPVLLGVGTPNRVLKLCELEALSLDRLRLLLVDVQRDAKLLTLLDIQEVRSDFSKLFAEHCLRRFGALKLGLVDGS
eukprot:CAMPEP_0117678224 /NCGR_PEP_ID=MMETSP0804-20121206/17183_1 /TAXON_ID=1074897 /ORGANISM="Tetraselmis astigmatica, Strain CCMP880" /LENGTH=318 /DNA_ID=CAMNT_0005487597 /DNA_START=141 /DNA_END=1094 /DNA_ORIENTATION=+